MGNIKQDISHASKCSPSMTENPFCSRRKPIQAKATRVLKGHECTCTSSRSGKVLSRTIDQIPYHPICPEELSQSVLLLIRNTAKLVINRVRIFRNCAREAAMWSGISVNGRWIHPTPIRLDSDAIDLQRQQSRFYCFGGS